MMKYLFCLLLTSLLGYGSLPHQEPTVLTGRVLDIASGEYLIGAVVKISRDTGLVKATLTDVNGAYRVELEPGVYDVECSYTGYETQRILGVIVPAEKVKTLEILMNTGTVLNEVVVTAYRPPLLKQDETSSGVTLTADDIHRMPAPEARSATPKKSRKRKEEMAKEAEALRKDPPPAKPALYPVDGIRVETAPDAVERKFEARDDAYDLSLEGPPHIPGIPGQPSPRAGLLTAGEWNDLHNWNNHWVDLLKDGELEEFQTMYGFYPRQHFTVLLTNEQNFPLADVPVTLYDQPGNILWEARTDNTGRAELWANLFSAQHHPGQYRALAKVDGQDIDLGALKPAESGLNHQRIRRECQSPNTVDIVWAVDATGSMGDELEYLKTELLDVIGRVKAVNPNLGIRMGSVFYRDKEDEYLVKSSALNHDIAKTVDYIRKQSAGGGGDYPEAVHSALEEAIYRQPWSPEAIARICFLVLDASPHQEKEVLESLQKSIREAARRGIRIIPVTGSGIQKDTEFLMKFFGLATNGTYVFLTDHSGVGGKHLEPTTDEYKVELLNDLLVRLITEYSNVPTCEGKAEIRIAENEQDAQQPSPAPSIFYYPNPAVDLFRLELPFDAQKVTLYDSEGKAVRDLSALAAGTHTIAVNTLAPGFYTLRVWKDGQVLSGKVMVVRT